MDQICPMLMLAAISGQSDLTGHCLKKECALYVDVSTYDGNSAGCGLAVLAENSHYIMERMRGES